MKNLKRNKLLRLMALCLLGLFLLVEAVAQGAYTDGKAAQLNTSQVRKLMSLRAPIAVPTYIPAGYKLKSAGDRVKKIRDFWSIDYTLTYENAKGAVFHIVSENFELGEHPFGTILTGKNPFFDDEVRVVDVTDDDEVKANAQYATQWVKNKPAYVPKGARSRRQAYSLDSTALSPKEALKVMMSLRYLR